MRKKNNDNPCTEPDEELQLITSAGPDLSTITTPK